MTTLDIASHRLSNQHIAQSPFKKPSEVVSWLGAVQAQDYLGALWAVGLRLRNATEADIERAIADKTIVRTWPMRGTLHFVAPADVRWMLALLTPRVMANSARRHAQLALDDAIFARSQALFAEALWGGQQLTRKEMMDVLEQAGISTDHQRGYHILLWAAQTGLICFGPRRGKQPTYVLLDEWVPSGKHLTRDESLAELAHRYFTGHGPATLQDFMWWSGLAATDARAGLEMAKSHLAQEVSDGQTYWLASSLPTAQDASPTAYLLPAYDEYTVAYQDRRAVLNPLYAQQANYRYGIFNPTIIVDGQVVGTWKRTLKRDAVIITPTPFAKFNNAEASALAIAAEGYGQFIGLPAALHQ